MWRPRSLLWTVLGLIGYNPGILLAVRFDVWNRSRRCTSLMWLSCWRDVTRGRPERPLGVVRLSKPHQQWLYRVAMNTKMSSDNVLCQSCLEHTKSTKTLIFGETWHNTEINVIQTNVFFFSGSYSTKVHDFYPIFSHSMSTLLDLAFFCSSFSFNNLWPFMVYRMPVLTFVEYEPEKKNTFVWMTLISVLCHVSPKINVFVLLVCSKQDWHNTLSLDILQNRHSVNHKRSQIVKREWRTKESQIKKCTHRVWKYWIKIVYPLNCSCLIKQLNTQ
jgi:hypothetical protein